MVQHMAPAGAHSVTQPRDTRRLADSFPSIDYFERRRLPFIVGVNCFDGAVRYDTEEIRTALDLDPRVPVILCDVRARESGNATGLSDASAHRIAPVRPIKKHTSLMRAS